jgi:hypothetical protein
VREAIKLSSVSDRLLILKVTEPSEDDKMNLHRAIVQVNNDELLSLISEEAFTGSWSQQGCNVVL